MQVIKVIEVMTESPESWEHATKLAVEHAARTVRNVKSVYVQDFSAVVADNAVTMFRVTTRISFAVDQ